MTCWLLAALLLAGHPDDLNVRAEAALRAAVPAFAQRAATAQGPQPVGPDGLVAAGWAYLAAFEVTAEPAAKSAALAVAKTLADSQRESGGWPATLDPADRGWTRELAQSGQAQGDRTNRTDLSAPVTPEALRYLARVALLCGDDAAGAAAEYGPLSVIRYQRPDGSWPAAWPPSPTDPPTAMTTPALVTLLHQTALAPAASAAHRGGEWLLKARLAGHWPDDDGFWSSALLALVELSRSGDDRRWLTAARDALARRPATPALAEATAAVAAASKGRQQPDPSREARAWRTAQRTRDVATLLAAQTPDGLWLEDGQARTATFARNVRLLADFVREYEPLPAEFTTDPERPGPHRR